MEYAGQRKVGRDIEKKIKAEQSRSKSNKKKAALKKAYYYATLIKKNTKNKSQ